MNSIVKFTQLFFGGSAAIVFFYSFSRGFSVDLLIYLPQGSLENQQKITF